MLKLAGVDDAELWDWATSRLPGLGWKMEQLEKGREWETPPTPFHPTTTPAR